MRGVNVQRMRCLASHWQEKVIPSNHIPVNGGVVVGGVVAVMGLKQMVRRRHIASSLPFLNASEMRSLDPFSEER